MNHSEWDNIPSTLNFKLSRSTVILGKKVPLLDYTFYTFRGLPHLTRYYSPRSISAHLCVKVPPAAKRTKLPRENHSVPPRRQLGAGWCDPGSSKKGAGGAVGSGGFTRAPGSHLDPASIHNKIQASDATTLFDLSLLKRPIRSATRELREIEGVVLNRCDHLYCSKIRGSNFNLWSLKYCW